MKVDRSGKETIMIHKMPSPRPGYVRVVFELPSSIWADRIYLVGEFNGWSMNSTPFVQGRDGVWRVAVDLVAGRSYQFRYLVDGIWQTDYQADGWADNGFCSQNSIVDAVLQQEPIPAEEVSPLQESLGENERTERRITLGPRGQPQGIRYRKKRTARAAG